MIVNKKPLLKSARQLFQNKSSWAAVASLHKALLIIVKVGRLSRPLISTWQCITKIYCLKHKSTVFWLALLANPHWQFGVVLDNDLEAIFFQPGCQFCQETPGNLLLTVWQTKRRCKDNKWGTLLLWSPIMWRMDPFEIFIWLI